MESDGPPSTPALAREMRGDAKADGANAGGAKTGRDFGVVPQAD